MGRSYQKLHEYLNIYDSVRSLKMANLSCIHIPGEVFQNSMEYVEPSRASGVECFWKNCWRLFLQKSFIVDVTLGSKYAFGVVLLYIICVIRILVWPLKFSSEGMLFLVNTCAKEQQFYKTELLYWYLLKVCKNVTYLPLIYCQYPK